MPDPQSILLTYAQIAVALAGFSGVIAALGPSSREDWPPAARIYFEILFYSAMATIGFSVVPLLLLIANIDERLVWTTLSGIHLTYFISMFIYRSFQTRAMNAKSDINRVRTARASQFFFSLITLIQILNVFYFQEAWPYLAAILCAIGGTFMSYTAVLRMLWK